MTESLDTIYTTNPVGAPTVHQADPPAGDEGRVAIPLDPETALRGLLQVDPHAKPLDDSR